MFDQTVSSATVSPTGDARAKVKDALQYLDNVIGFLFWFNMPDTLFEREKFNNHVQSQTFSDDPVVDFQIKKALTIGEPRDYDAWRTGTRKAGTVPEDKQLVSIGVADIVRPGEDQDGNGYERWLVQKSRNPTGRTKSEHKVARLIYDPTRTPNDRLVIDQTDTGTETTDICNAIRAAYTAELAGSSTERFRSAVKRCMDMLQSVTVDTARRVHFCHPQHVRLIESLEGLVAWVGANFKVGFSTIEAPEFTVFPLYDTPKHREKARAAVQRGLTREAAKLVEQMNALEKNEEGLEEHDQFKRMNAIKTEVKDLRKKAVLYRAELEDTADQIKDDLEIVVKAYERMLGAD